MSTRVSPYPETTNKQKKLLTELEKVSKEASELERRKKRLSKRKDELRDELDKSFGDHDRRRLDADHIVVRKKVKVEDTIGKASDVGKVIRKGYSYYKFTVEEI